ncbi:MAG: FtsQ-type POTRA domain-containing protein, partial [Oscillospiraceae bacterium]|nr:FtsQ-type POTRA domain-containing protein [Oscillospiraceae bacterium]
ALVAAAVVTAAAVAALTLFFRVDEIRVSGSEIYPAEEIAGACGIRRGDSLLLFSKPRAVERIREGRVYLDSVTIRRRLPDTLEITVTDRAAAAAFEANGAYWTCSGDGTLLELTMTPPENAALILGAKLKGSKAGETFTCEDGARQTLLREIFAGIGDNGLWDKVTRIDVVHTFAIVVTYGSEFDVVLGSSGRIADELASLETVIGEIRSQGYASGTINMTSSGVRYTPDRYAGSEAE